MPEPTIELFANNARVGDANPLPVKGTEAGTDVAASSNVASNTATSASLPAAVGKTTHISGFSVTVDTGTAGPTGLVTLTGVVGGPLNYRIGGPPSGAAMVLDFARPLPAAAPNTAITVNVPALGATSGAVAVVVRGYQK